MTGRLLVVGIDGGDHRIVEELMDAGRLPALAGLRERGAVAPVETEADILPDSVWPKLVSGAELGDDTLLHFYGFDPRTMGLRFRREAGAEVEPFWLHLPDRGAGGLVADIPELHPHPDSRADESCCWHSHAPPHEPVFTSRRLARSLRSAGTPPALRDPDYEQTPSLEADLALSDRLARSAAHRGRALLAAGRDRPALCAVFHELHTAVHALGHHYEPDHWYRPFEAHPELLFRAYEAVDAAIAPLLDAFADANVAVVAARGIRAVDYAGDLLEELFARAGLLARPGDGAAAGGSSAAPAERLRRLVPAHVRRRVALSILPERVQHRFAGRAFRERYHWPATRAFPLPTWTTGLVRVNLAGREAAGVVPPADLEAALAEATRLIHETVDADTGAPLASRVIRLRERYGLDGASGPVPDLLVEWAGRRPARAARHPRLGTWEAAPAVTHAWSAHGGLGLVLLAGPAVRRVAEVEARDLLGLAPTLLALAGRRPPASASPPWRDVLAT